jgi:hypothetical protein
MSFFFTEMILASPFISILIWQGTLTGERLIELQVPIDVAGAFHIKKKPAFHEEDRLY